MQAYELVMNDIPVITVDGPSGTGKGTLCSHLANWLNWHFLDSGALYRVLALAAINRQIALDDIPQLAQLGSQLELQFSVQTAGQLSQVILEGKDVSDDIRTEDCGKSASIVAAIPEVRLALLGRQQAFQIRPGLIADGRDMGTVVFPDADLKLYLTASAEERAKRRHKQLLEKGISANLRDLSADIAERDARDSQRSVSPLKPAEDAIIIDTSHSSIDEVVGDIREMVVDTFPDIS
ncbi:MAG: (d)CMP kinase [Pseudomonadota bacterium]